MDVRAVYWSRKRLRIGLGIRQQSQLGADPLVAKAETTGAIGMTPQEKLIRALAAAKPHYPGWSIAEIEKSSAYLAVLEALTDLGKPTQMTPQEKLIRAREACAAEWPGEAAEYRAGRLDHHGEMKPALRALTDLDKPIPDADEAWRPFIAAIEDRAEVLPLDKHERDLIARIKAALHLIPEQYR